MSSRRAARHLNPFRVQLARETQLRKHELAMKMVSERVKTDPEFAADVLKIGGDKLREDIKKDAQETIARHNGAPIKPFDKNPVPDLPSDINPNATEEDLKNAILIHCRTSNGQVVDLLKQLKEQGKPIPEGLKIAMDEVEKYNSNEIIEDRE